MSGYEYFPPITKFKLVLRACPRAAELYVSLWRIVPLTRQFSVSKKEVKKTFLISPTLFRNHLLCLGRLDILSFEETTDFFVIDFMEVNPNGK